MPAAKRSRGKQQAPEVQPPAAGIAALPPVPIGPIFISDTRTSELGINDDPQQRMTDAATVYSWIDGCQWIGQEDLVRAAVSSWGDSAVDRLNVALGVLEKLGRIHRLGS